MIQIPLTPDEFAALAVKAQQEQGITLTGDEGKITKMGVTAGYQYAEGLLRVTILEKPFFVTTEYCEEQLTKALKAV
jgi:hypothetical protein